MSPPQSKDTSGSATSQADIAPVAQQGSAGSVVRRIQASASGLVRQSILNPSASSVTGSLASSTSNASKGGSGSSSAGPSQTTLSSIPADRQPSSVHNSTESTRELTEWESFRSQPRREESHDPINRIRFEDFMSLNSELSLSETPQWPEIGGNVGDIEEQPVLRSHLSGNNVPSSQTLQHNISGHTASKTTGLTGSDTDGAAVVALLSDPNFCMDEDPIGSSIFGMENNFDVQPKIPEVDGQAATPCNQVSAINPLDLLPDFKGSQNSFSTTQPTKLSAATSSLSESYIYDKSQLRLHHGDLQPWLDMLNKYQDEVWGDMLFLVQEAREEAKAATEYIPEDQPATRRLRMLLKHLT